MIQGLLRGVVMIAIAIFSSIACSTTISIIKENKDIKNQNTNIEKSFYGISTQTYDVESATIMHNQLLSHILIKNDISPKTIEEISQKDETFDVKKMRSGNVFHLFFNNENEHRLDYLVYEHSSTEYLKIGFKDSLEFNYHRRPTNLVKKMAMGTIETNLWDAMLKNNIDPMMSIELSEIYAWSIDFFDLKKGDKFYVIYDDEVLNDTLSVGIKKIRAALFNHQNKEFYAIHFPQDTEHDYFNEEGSNLRDQFLQTPLKYSRISSKFTKRRYHPVLKIYRPHSGIDYAAPIGTPVYSVGDGIVLKKGYHKKGAGNFIKIKHDKTYTTQYAHLQKFANGLRDGDFVKQGQLIGYVGSTGYSTGPHLDFRFFENGHAIDPLAIHEKSEDPIQQINRFEFERLRDVYIYQLRGHKPQFLVACKDYMAEHEEA